MTFYNMGCKRCFLRYEIFDFMGVFTVFGVNKFNSVRESILSSRLRLGLCLFLLKRLNFCQCCLLGRYLRFCCLYERTFWRECCYVLR